MSSYALELARRVLGIEADAVRALIERIDERFLGALELILERRGRVVVSGIGKSGHIARKIASTLSSTGTPAYFLHPAEALHGDLGMIESGDVFIALSHSGESEELLDILPLVKRRGAKLIAITGRHDSTLARQADVLLDAAHDLGLTQADSLLDPAVAVTYRDRLVALLSPRVTLQFDGRPVEIVWGGIDVVPERQSVRLAFSVRDPSPGLVAIRAYVFPYDPIHQTFINVYEEDAIRLQAILENHAERHADEHQQQVERRQCDREAEREIAEEVHR